MLSSQGKLKKRRIGRGYGSGKGGHTVGRGQKGQRSRSGFNEFRAWTRESKVRSFPRLRGIGKRKSTRRYAKQRERSLIFNVGDLNRFAHGTTINMQSLKAIGLLKGKTLDFQVKILGGGDLEKKIFVEGIRVSDTAREKIEKAGGKVI